MLGKEAFCEWGWRIPFLLSFVLLGVSVWIRLKMNESPAFKKMKEEGKGSKAPLTEAFGQWRNAKIALLALFGAVVGQALVWYSGPVLRAVLPAEHSEDRRPVGKPDGCRLAPSRHRLFRLLRLAVGQDRPQADHHGGPPACHAHLLPAVQGDYWAGNPALAGSAAERSRHRHRGPGDCKFQFNPTGTAKFTTSCDIATAFLTKNSVPYDVVTTRLRVRRRR